MVFLEVMSGEGFTEYYSSFMMFSWMLDSDSNLVWQDALLTIALFKVGS